MSVSNLMWPIRKRPPHMIFLQGSAHDTSNQGRVSHLRGTEMRPYHQTQKLTLNHTEKLKAVFRFHFSDSVCTLLHVMCKLSFPLNSSQVEQDINDI